LKIIFRQAKSILMKLIESNNKLFRQTKSIKSD